MSLQLKDRARQWPIGQRQALQTDVAGFDLESMLSLHQNWFKDFDVGLASNDPVEAQFRAWSHSFVKSQAITLKRLLPIFLRLKGKPYSLQDFFPLEPLFRTRLPRKLTLKGSRQISKSTSLMAWVILLGLVVPHINILTVTPYFEMTRRLSQLFCKPFIEDSPFHDLFGGAKTMQNVLQRTLPNNSALHFSYAFTDATRTRGVPADINVFDEVQSALQATLDLVTKTLSASPHHLEVYAGTPLTTDGPLEYYWQDSSQAEWVIKCRAGSCGYWNIPSLEYDLLQMIGKQWRDVSEKNPGVVCAKCTRPVNPRWGHYEHRYPEKRWEHAGYHLPQLLFPLHYADPPAWKEFNESFYGLNGTPRHAFLNECCGESYDSGTKLIALSELKRACSLPWPNQYHEAKKHIGNYVLRVMAIDWGGGGVHRGQSSYLHTSYTAVAILGMRHDGTVDCIYGRRLNDPLDPFREALELNGMFREFKCRHIVHDARGHGRNAGKILEAQGFREEHFLHVSYVGEMAELLVENPPNEVDPRTTYSLDQYLAVTMACELIRAGRLNFFQYADRHTCQDMQALVLEDFTRLLEDKKAVPGRRDSHRIRKDPSGPDDFAHACVIGTWMLYFLTGKEPDLTEHYIAQRAAHLKEIEEHHQRLELEMAGEFELAIRQPDVHPEAPPKPVEDEFAPVTRPRRPKK